MDWSFSASAHGKGPVDGIGGTMKRTVWRRIMQGQADINDVKDFAQVAKEACPSINVIVIGADAVSECKSSLETKWQSNPPATIPQTHQMHYAHAINAHVLEVSDVSPFLGSVAKFTEAQIFESETESENQPEPEQMPPDPDATKSPEDDLSFNVTIGCYVVVEYDSIYYLGVASSLQKTVPRQCS